MILAKRCGRVEDCTLRYYKHERSLNSTGITPEAVDLIKETKEYRNPEASP